jgi:hypothetical protein
MAVTTQDGYDWPNNRGDEQWPRDTHAPMAPYFREQLEREMVPVPRPRQLTVPKYRDYICP